MIKKVERSELKHIKANEVFSIFAQSFFLKSFFQQYDLTIYINLVKEINTLKDYSETLENNGFEKEFIKENFDTEENLIPIIDYLMETVEPDFNEYVYNGFFQYENSEIKDFSKDDLGKRIYF